MRRGRDFLQLFVRINIEPEFEKSLYEEAPANIQGRESQHHDSNDLQMTTPPPLKGGVLGGVDLFNTGNIKSGKFLPLNVLHLKIAGKFLSVTSLPKNNQTNLDRF